jgi:hypothetical protein
VEGSMKRIGVRFMWYDEPQLDALKREALYFDQITICGYPYPLEAGNKQRTIDYLCSQDLINIIDTQFLKGIEPYLGIGEKKQLQALHDILNYTLGGEINDYGIDVLTRMGSIHLQINDKQSLYFPIVSEYPVISHKEAKRSQVVNLVINQFPQIDSSVKWEQIVEFKQDPDSVAKYLALRNWINEILKSNRDIHEIEEKLEYLLNNYQRHMELHKMKYNKSNLELVVTSSLEILENIARLKFSKIAKTLFSFKENELELLEAELKAPGNELAYIDKISTQFH